jgi:hypothetical protein
MEIGLQDVQIKQAALAFDRTAKAKVVEGWTKAFQCFKVGT